MEIIISLVILLFSAIVHEVCHGLMAEYLGDSTAREEGRITLNPVSHIDPIGSIILPMSLFMLGSPVIFGSAKPVPVNFNRLTRFRNMKLGAALVSFAGPLSNFVLACIFAFIIKFGLSNNVSEPVLMQAILLNLSLGVFNLMPIPPLDGSKILFALVPYEQMYLQILSYEKFGFILIYLFLTTGLLGKIFTPVVFGFFRLFGLQIY